MAISLCFFYFVNCMKEIMQYYCHSYAVLSLLLLSLQEIASVFPGYYHSTRCADMPKPSKSKVVWYRGGESMPSLFVCYNLFMGHESTTAFICACHLQVCFLFLSPTFPFFCSALYQKLSWSYCGFQTSLSTVSGQDQIREGTGGDCILSKAPTPSKKCPLSVLPSKSDRSTTVPAFVGWLLLWPQLLTPLPSRPRSRSSLQHFLTLGMTHLHH